MGRIRLRGIRTPGDFLSRVSQLLPSLASSDVNVDPRQKHIRQVMEASLAEDNFGKGASWLLWFDVV